jgi:hypothetical protein
MFYSASGANRECSIYCCLPPPESACTSPSHLSDWWCDIPHDCCCCAETALHTCAQLVASAKSPDGPWTKLAPAVATPTGAPPGWTGGWNTRRLDSGRALVIGGKRGYWTKGVSGTNVASEGLCECGLLCRRRHRCHRCHHNAKRSDLNLTPAVLSPRPLADLPHNPSTWEPPYAEWSHNPLFAEQPSWDPSGYENCEFFRGPPDTDELHVWVRAACSANHPLPSTLRQSLNGSTL